MARWLVQTNGSSIMAGYSLAETALCLAVVATRVSAESVGCIDDTERPG